MWSAYGLDNMLFKELKTKYKSLLKLSSYCPQVAFENKSRLCIISLKMYSKLLKHFWIGSCLSTDKTQSAQCWTLVNNPLKQDDVIDTFIN